MINNSILSEGKWFSLYATERLAELGVDAIDVSGGNESITKSIENCKNRHSGQYRKRKLF